MDKAEVKRQYADSILGSLEDARLCVDQLLGEVQALSERLWDADHDDLTTEDADDLYAAADDLNYQVQDLMSNLSMVQSECDQRDSDLSELDEEAE